MGIAFFTYGLAVALAIAVLIAAFTDLRHRRIGNRLTGVIALSAPLFWIANDLALWPGIAAQVGVAILVFIIGALLFRLGQMGGGDVKLLAALALVIEPGWFLCLILITTIANGVLTAALIWWRRRQRLAGRAAARGGVPYAVAIAPSVMAVLMIRYQPVFELGLAHARIAS